MFQPGARQHETWNKAVLGPAFPHLDTEAWAGRLADLMHFDVPMYSDQEADHFGFSSVDSQTTTLYRDGQQVGVSIEFQPAEAIFDVPVEAGTYRLDTTAVRSVSNLSTKVSSSWTFRSGHVDGEDEQALPMMAVRFAPDVDEHNRVPSGRLTLPVWVQRQEGAQYGTLTGLTVAVSYDDGASWQPVQLAGGGDHRTAVLDQPRGASYVSLRASAADRAGNQVSETIIHAYALR